MKIYLSIWVLILNFQATFSQTVRVDINKVRLLSLSNEEIVLAAQTHDKPFVLILLSPDCPISQKYTPILRGLSELYASVQFLGIFTKWDNFQEIEAFKTEYNFNLACFKDNKNKLIKKIKGTVMPEVYFFDRRGVLLYAGAIDNWFYALGKYRQEATECYLEDAINAHLYKKPITIKRTKAIGCIIEK